MIEQFATALTLVKNAISLVKDGKELLPDAPKKRAAEEAIFQAETALKIAEAQAAVALGYATCQCTWPPQICLREKGGTRRCPKCGQEPDEDFSGFTTGGSY